MSDIGFPELDVIVLAFIFLCFIGPTLFVGLVFLVIGIFVSKPRMLTVSYLVVSTAITTAVLLWLADWQNMPEVGTWAFPIGLGMALLGWGLFGVLRWLARKIRS